jgi:hypothetical protein
MCLSPSGEKMLVTWSLVKSIFWLHVFLGCFLGRMCNFWCFHSRGEWGCMKRKIVWGKVKHSCYFSAKTSLKIVSNINKVRVLICPVFHTAPFTPKYISDGLQPNSPQLESIWNPTSRTLKTYQILNWIWLITDEQISL